MRAFQTAGRVRHTLALDHVAALGNGLVCHLNAVGPHVGDQAGHIAINGHAFIELLRHLHGALRGESQACARLPAAAWMW
jgi:hypothetical protein